MRVVGEYERLKVVDLLRRRHDSMQLCKTARRMTMRCLVDEKGEEVRAKGAPSKQPASSSYHLARYRDRHVHETIAASLLAARTRPLLLSQNPDLLF